MSVVYFDYNATTPVDEKVRQAMLPFLGEVWGNPSSIHQVGRRARALLDEARERAALVLGAKPSEVVFTSGGTESANTAILGTARRLKAKGCHIITSQIEHHCVLHACDYLAKHEGFEVSYLPVDSEGRIHPDTLLKALRPDTVLVSLMAANNEIGTVQPVSELGAICRERGVIFHTDAVQWFGKEPFSDIHQFNADLVSICAHKIHGPKGAGALYIRSPLHPDPLLLGGAHENERRAGTENLAGIAGLVTALELFVRQPVFDRAHLEPLTNRLYGFLAQQEPIRLVTPKTGRLANTVSFVAENAEGIALLAGLDMEGICASSGSACSAGSLEPSHVIQALGYPGAQANALVRLSLGRESTLQDVEQFERVLPGVLNRVQLSE
jgi:cysteine desulfurase